MSLPLLYVCRQGALAVVPFDELQANDLVLTTTGRYVAAWVMKSSLNPNPPDPPRISDVIAALALAGGLLLGAGWAIDQFLKPEATSKKRPHNREPLEAWKRDYVSMRDGWRCTYCGCRVTRRTRHIDHSRSRRNGGSNHLNNLRTACLLCNLSKGSLNARQFLNVAMD